MKKEVGQLIIFGFVGLVVLPIVIGTAINLTCRAITGVANGVSTMQYERKIEKGLKKGNLIEIDGRYYTVANVEGA